MVRLFAIYSKKDNVEEKLLEIKRRLEENRHAEVDFLEVDEEDRKYSAGWKRDATQRIKDSTAVLLVFGDNSATGRNTLWEIRKATSLKKHILIYNTTDPRKLKKWISDNHELFSAQGKRVKSYTLEDLEAKINSHDSKIYDVFSKGLSVLIEDRPSETEAHLFEQYRLYQQTTEELVQRRQSVNEFYNTLNTALVAFCGVIIGIDPSFFSNHGKIIMLFGASVSSWLFNIAWRKTLDTYKIINTGKLRVINSIERQLPLRLYDVEYRVMKDELNPWTYESPFTYERKVPLYYSLLVSFLSLCYLVWFIVQTYFPQILPIAAQSSSTFMS